MIGFERFRNKIVRPPLHGLYGSVHCGISGDDDDEDFLVERLNMLEDFHTVHPRHFKIQKHDGDVCFGKDGNRLFAPANLDHFESHAG